MTMMEFEPPTALVWQWEALTRWTFNIPPEGDSMHFPGSLSPFFSKLKLNNKPNHGVIFILIGPAGVGKSTILRRLLAQHEDFAMPRGLITRPRRQQEINHPELIDSDVISVKEFEALNAAGKLTSVAQIHGHWYGTPIDRFTEPLAQGRNVIRILNVDGADAAMRDLVDYPLVTIFLTAPMPELAYRLIGRGDEPEDIRTRLYTAEYELSRQEDWDYVIDTNREFGDIVKDVESIIALHQLYP